MSGPIPLDDLETFAHGLDHPEGIALAPDGHLYVGGEAGQLYRIGHDGTAEQLLTTDGFLLGIAADGASRIYACDQVKKAVWRIDPSSGSMEVYSSGSPDRPMRLPNWASFDAFGNLYVTDSGDWKGRNGLVWVVWPGGVTKVWTEQVADFPNGCAVAPDGSAVYVLESTPGRLNEIPIEPDGSAGTKRVLLELPGTVPDGVAIEADGSFLIACYRPDVIYRWSHARGLETLAEDPEGTTIGAPTNLVFVGDDLTEWVVPNIARWHLTKGGRVHGTPLFYPSSDVLKG